MFQMTTVPHHLTGAKMPQLDDVPQTCVDFGPRLSQRWEQNLQPLLAIPLDTKRMFRMQRLPDRTMSAFTVMTLRLSRKGPPFSRSSLSFLVVWSNVALVTKRGHEFRVRPMPDCVSFALVNGWKDGGCWMRATGFLLAEQIAHPSQSFHGLWSNRFSIYPRPCWPGHQMHSLLVKPIFPDSGKN